jgi:hypothetical protein
MAGDLPRRENVPLVFDELDYQMATQAYLWALPLVSYAQWQAQHRDVFGATDYDLVHYASYRDRLGLITANATTPYILTFIDLSRTGPVVVDVPPGRPPVAGRTSGSVSSGSSVRWVLIGAGAAGTSSSRPASSHRPPRAITSTRPAG